FPNAFRRCTRFFTPFATLGGSHSYCSSPKAAGHDQFFPVTIRSMISENPSKPRPNPDSTVPHFLPSLSLLLPEGLFVCCSATRPCSPIVAVLASTKLLSFLCGASPAKAGSTNAMQV